MSTHRQPSRPASANTVSLEVRVTQKGKAVERFVVTTSPALIGRDEKADVRLPSTAVSRAHATLHFDATGVRIVDAGSTNGFSVGGRRVPEATLTPDDVVKLCGFELVCTLHTGATSSQARRLAEELSEGWGELVDDEPEREQTNPFAVVDAKPRNAPNVVRAARQPTTSYESNFAGAHVRAEQPSGLHESEAEGEAAPSAEESGAASASGRDEPSTERPRPEASLDEASATAPPRASPISSADDEDDDDTLPPADLPPLLRTLHETVLPPAAPRHVAQMVEVVLAKGDRIRDTALLAPGTAWWWAPVKRYVRNPFAAVTASEFPMVFFEPQGSFRIQVPQDGAMRMYRRGPGATTTFRDGPFMGMRCAGTDHAEVSASGFTLHVRCVDEPPPLRRSLSLTALEWLVWFPAAAGLLLIAWLLVRVPTSTGFVVDALTRKDQWVEVSVQTAKAAAVFEPEQLVEPPMALEPLEPLPAPPSQTVREAPQETREPDPTKRAAPRPKKNARAQPESAAPNPTDSGPAALSVSDFKVAGMLETLPSITISPTQGPKIATGPRILRGDGGGPTGLVDKSGRGSNITPPGRLEMADVTRVVNSHSRELHECYHRGLADNPVSQGRIELQWVVDVNGVVSASRVLYDELGSPTATKCIREALGRWRFPVPKGGPATVTFPFRFANPNL